jgi:hypothetical protein
MVDKLKGKSLSAVTGAHFYSRDIRFRTEKPPGTGFW